MYFHMFFFALVISQKICVPHLLLLISVLCSYELCFFCFLICCWTLMLVVMYVLVLVHHLLLLMLVPFLIHHLYVMFLLLFGGKFVDHLWLSRTRWCQTCFFLLLCPNNAGNRKWSPSLHLNTQRVFPPLQVWSCLYEKYDSLCPRFFYNFNFTCL